MQEFNSDLSCKELADVIEVIVTLKKLPQYENVEFIMDKNKKNKGNFDKKIIIKEVLN